MKTDEDRLRRRLRALTAVNRQLQAQLEGNGGRAIAPAPGARRELADVLTPVSAPRTKVRRSTVGDEWLEQLAARSPATTPTLRRHPDGATYVIEGDGKRRIRSGLLVAALEERLGPRIDATADELDAWEEGAPVEALEGPTGPPFLVVGGEQIPLRGLPLTHPVSAESVALFDAGPELNISPSGLARARVRNTLSIRHVVGRVQRASARRGGFIPAVLNFVKRQIRRIRRRLG